MVRMIGYWNIYKLDIPMQWPMAMLIMMSNKRKPPSRLPSQDETLTMLENFTKIALSNSDN
jgi:hypothetical protein